MKRMSRSYLGSVVAVAVAICAGASLGLWSAPTAAATSPDVTGKTYSDAQAALKSAGFTAVIATTVGDKTPQSSCKVVRQQDFPITAVFVGGDQPTLYPITLPNVPTSNQVMLTLVCYQASDAKQSQATGTGDITTKPTQQASH